MKYDITLYLQSHEFFFWTWNVLKNFFSAHIFFRIIIITNFRILMLRGNFWVLSCPRSRVQGRVHIFFTLAKKRASAIMMMLKVQEVPQSVALVVGSDLFPDVGRVLPFAGIRNREVGSKNGLRLIF